VFAKATSAGVTLYCVKVKCLHAYSLCSHTQCPQKLQTTQNLESAASWRHLLPCLLIDADLCSACFADLACCAWQGSAAPTGVCTEVSQPTVPAQQVTWTCGLAVTGNFQCSGEITPCVEPYAALGMPACQTLSSISVTCTLTKLVMEAVCNQDLHLLSCTLLTRHACAFLYRVCAS